MQEKNVKENAEAQTSMGLLEEALVLCKFGKFHVRLLLATLMAVFASTSVTTTSSYILPSAECDLEMSIMEKGFLNAMPFFGQVGAALFTGFMIDAFGRKIFLVGGNLGIFLCTLLEGTSQSFWMLLLGKLLDGIFLSLCVSATPVMVTEFTHKGVRDRVLLLFSSFMSISLIMAALVAWGLLPPLWHFVIIKDYFEFHSWNIYLYVSSIWSLLAALLYYSLPESPKFLLSHGQENEALEVLKTIYHENTGNPKESFDIKSLNASGVFVPTSKISLKKQMVNGLMQAKELFQKPLIYKLILFSCATFVCLLAYSALRLWYPQLSTIIENYENLHGQTDQFCLMIDEYTVGLAKNASLATASNTTQVCVPHLSGSETYINGIILGCVSFISIGISGSLVDLLGQKPLMFVLLIICAVCSSALYWTNSSIQIALLVSMTCAFVQAAMSLMHNILIRVFPTTVRTLALSVILMVGRIGSLLGNILFPALLKGGCMMPFLTLSAVTLCVAGLVYFFPNPNKGNNGTGDA